MLLLDKAVRFLTAISFRIVLRISNHHSCVKDAGNPELTLLNALNLRLNVQNMIVCAYLNFFGLEFVFNELFCISSPTSFKCTLSKWLVVQIYSV